MIDNTKKREQSIPLMHYSTKEKKHIFSFLGINTLTALKVLPNNLYPVDIKFAATNGIDYLFPDNYKGNSIDDLIAFIDANSKLIFINMELTFDNEMQLITHDDNEATYYFPKKLDYKRPINNLLKTHNYNSNIIIDKLINNIDTYMIFKQPDILEKKYADFDEYMKTGKP